MGLMRRDILRGLLCVGADLVTMPVLYFAAREVDFEGWWSEIGLITVVSFLFAFIFAGGSVVRVAISFVLLCCLNVFIATWIGVEFYL